MATATKHPPANLQTKDSSNGSVRVEIFDQGYNLRGSDAEYILKLAAYVDAKMRAVAEHTQTVDTARVAVLAAINIADEYHLTKGNVAPVPDVKQRAKRLSNALDEVLDVARRAV
ncbi:MAG: cell division protein ZapA [Terriglobales bacterium]